MARLTIRTPAQIIRVRDGRPGPYRNHCVNEEWTNIATSQDLVKLAAASWLGLRGIENVPQFHDICRQVVGNTDAWLRENREVVQEVRNSPEVRLFLIKQGAAGLLTLMHEAAEAAEPEVREAAREALAARNDFQLLLETTGDTIKAIEDVLQRFELLARNGWTSPLLMDIAAFHRFRVLIVSPNMTVQNIEQWFIAHYRSGGLAQLSNDMRSSHHLRFWKPLIDQCFRAFERKDYQICIPSLLLVFEGIIAKLWDVAFQSKKKRMRFFERNIARASSQSVEQYLWKSVKTFTEEVFEAALRDKQVYSVPKRHLILHGKSDPSMWDEADCLRLLQAISTTALLYNQVAAEKKQGSR